MVITRWVVRFSLPGPPTRKAILLYLTTLSLKSIGGDTLTDGIVSFGREKIYTDYDVVTAGNVLDILEQSFDKHSENAREIDYLYEYYKGNQPVLNRTKEYREEILNKIVVNRANMIVDFKTGYLVGEPIQYVNRSGEDNVSEYINKLNDYMFAEDKSGRDKELADWMHIAGTGFRMAMPDSSVELDEDESPFEVYTLDPRYTWVVYHSGLGEKPKVAFKYIVRQDGTNVFSAYTDSMYYEIIDGNIVRAEPHSLGMIPIIEYPANNARLGAFEIVLSLLDALNEAESNRLDAVEQFVQSLLVFKGVDIDSDDFSALKMLGGIKIPPEGDVKYLVQEMNQQSTQTLVDDLFDTILTICAVPSQALRSTSDSSNNGAVILKHGWESAEARAKDTELMFKQSEKVFLKLILKICDTLGQMPIKVSDVEIRFTRRNYENIQSKAQVLCEMLSSEKIHPKLAFASCNLFPDAELAYTMSMEYWEERKQQTLAELAFDESQEKTDQTQLGTAAEQNGFGGADAGGYYENR